MGDSDFDNVSVVHSCPFVLGRVLEIIWIQRSFPPPVPVSITALTLTKLDTSAEEYLFGCLEAGSVRVGMKRHGDDLGFHGLASDIDVD